jgi:signal peptidase I
MNFFERRRYAKLVRHLLREARHAKNMRGDVADPEFLLQLGVAEATLAEAWVTRDAEQIEQAGEELSDSILKVSPTRSFPRIRENVEILAVALAVAMGCRTYFVQPFKIPTGSMQPTLYGITVQPQASRTFMDTAPLNIIQLALFGERYIEVKASLSGQVDTRYSVDEESMVFYVKPVSVRGEHGDDIQAPAIPHKIRRGLTLYFSPGDYVSEGQVMASGRLKIGDHIFVDKIRYNFTRPKRGQIIVFSTDAIQYPRIRPDSFYIKRLAALPGEAVSIDPPYLVINGQRVEEPYPFHRLLTDKDEGYIGYTLPHKQPDAQAFIGSSGDKKVLGPRSYLPLGDNTAFSLDGRYFGPVDRDSLVGPAFMVYWPFTKRWGPVQ